MNKISKGGGGGPNPSTHYEHLIYPVLLVKFGMQVFLTNSSLRILGRFFFALYHPFSLEDSLGWFSMGSHCRNILLIAGVMQGLTLGPTHFLMNFLMTLSVMLLSMLMILLCTPSGTGLQLCGNSKSLPLNLNLTYKTLQNGAGSGLLISMLETLNLFLFACLNSCCAIDIEIDGSAHDGNLSKML